MGFAMNNELIEKTKAFVTPILEDNQMDLVDFKMNRQGRRYMIELFVDTFNGGITIGECARINRLINDRMSEEDLIEEDYVLAVSSPGLDAPLRTQRDFLRARNKEVQFLLAEQIEEKQEHIGVIEDADEERVQVKSNEGTINIPIGIIKRAVQII